jgi:flagellar biosynthetic protein FliP
MRRALTFLLSLALTLLPPSLALAQKMTLDLGDNGDHAVTTRIVELVALLTIIPLAPSILLMTTSFTRIVIVLSVLRTALGLQQSPPNQVLVSLALFLTLFVMMPVLQTAYHDGIAPLMEERIDEKEALLKTAQPFHRFMMKNLREKDLRLFMDLSHTKNIEKPDDTPFHVLIPAFMLGELRRAFEISFLIYIPFLVIDMLIASTLMAMGMMMLPPVLLSLPFKLIFFALIDGWYMLSGSLVRSFVMP